MATISQTPGSDALMVRIIRGGIWCRMTQCAQGIISLSNMICGRQLRSIPAARRSSRLSGRWFCRSWFCRSWFSRCRLGCRWLGCRWLGCRWLSRSRLSRGGFRCGGLSSGLISIATSSQSKCADDHYHCEKNRKLLCHYSVSLCPF